MAAILLELANSFCFNLGWIRHCYSMLDTGILGYLCAIWDAVVCCFL